MESGSVGVLDTGNQKENIRYIGLLAALDCLGIMEGRRDECETVLGHSAFSGIVAHTS